MNKISEIANSDIVIKLSQMAGNGSSCDVLGGNGIGGNGIEGNGISGNGFEAEFLKLNFDKLLKDFASEQ